MENVTTEERPESRACWERLEEWTREKEEIGDSHLFYIALFPC